MEWMVQLWKGQYGYILNGCEIGLYYRDFDDDELVDDKGRKFYKCADDDMLVQMELTMYKNNKLFFHRSKQYSWWLTGFKLGTIEAYGLTPTSTQVLSVSATIYFTDPEMMDIESVVLCVVGEAEKTGTVGVSNLSGCYVVVVIAENMDSSLSCR